MAIGFWYMLKATIAAPAGRYKVVDITGDAVVVANRDGKRSTFLRAQFESLVQVASPEPAKTRAHDSIPYHAHGMLWAFDYKVGRDGLPSEQRRSILRDLMTRPAARLPQVNESDYQAAWGEAGTYLRLRKTLAALNTLATNSEAKANPAEEAIQHWRSDAEWLLSEYKHLLPGQVTEEQMRLWADAMRRDLDIGTK